jgi:hypothetical protein
MLYCELLDYFMESMSYLINVMLKKKKKFLVKSTNLPFEVIIKNGISAFRFC